MSLLDKHHEYRTHFKLATVIIQLYKHDIRDRNELKNTYKKFNKLT